MMTVEKEKTNQFDEHARSIAKRQYMQKTDGDLLGMFRRVADWVASNEIDQAHWAKIFYELMLDKKFCPGGRVLAGAGTQHGNVLNCFVQGATEFAPESFAGVMEVASKLALVTKVGGGNGVNLDVYAPKQGNTSVKRGFVYMKVDHPDVEDFIKGLMRPPTQPDGEKRPLALRNWTRVVYGQVNPEIARLARQHGVLVGERPNDVLTVPDDMKGIIEAAQTIAWQATQDIEPQIDLSLMRPEGAAILGSGGTSSGPVSFLFEIFDNFLEWANLGAEKSGPVNTLRYCYAPVLRVVRQGGCLHPDTLVYTSRGTLRLRELVDPHQLGWQYQTMQVATDEGFKDSFEVFNNGIAETLQIELENGLNLQGTPNHKLKIIRNNQKEWCRFDELKPGDWVIQVLDQHTGNPVILDPIGEQHFNTKEVDFPKTVDEKLAFLLGYLWGDGFISSDRIGFSVAHDSMMVEEIPKLFFELFGLTLQKQQKSDDKSLIFVTKSVSLIAWLKKNGLFKGKAIELDIPKTIRQANRNVVGAFLRGLFEADGTIVHLYPQLSTASQQLAEDVLVLLTGLGIPAKLTRYEAREDRFSNKEHYRIRVLTAKGLGRYLERVGIPIGSRFEVLYSFQPDTDCESFWPLPHAQVLLETAFNSLEIGKKGTPSVYTPLRKTLSRYICDERQLTITGYEKLQENPILNKFLIDQDNEYYWQVISIRNAGPSLTLDLSVEENHTYLAGGFVSHNTRRGAGMATLSIENPDILDFLTAKDLDREAAEGDISTFNISILVTEAFWQVLQADGLWNIRPSEVPAKYYLAEIDTEYGGNLPSLPIREIDGAKGVPVYRNGIPAKWFWRQIAEHAWSTGEPGLIFIDRINELSALRNLGPQYQIKSTNPCITGNTMIAVADGRGAVSIKELAEIGADVPVYTMDKRGNPTVRWLRNPRLTGENLPIYKITFDDGLEVRVTANHKFNLTDGTAKQAIELRPNDSIASLTRFQATFDEALPMQKRKSQDYIWLTSGRFPIGEHRLIASFALNRPLKRNEVVHHCDFNGLNNHPNNLLVMDREEHNRLHREYMLGDNNPMRERWWGQLSEEERNTHRTNMSQATSGKNNGRYSGKSHKDIAEAAKQLVVQLGRGFTKREWQNFAGKAGLPKSFSKYRLKEFGLISNLSNKIGAELSLPTIPDGVGHSRQTIHNLELYRAALQSGYIAVRHEGNYYPIVTKSCEGCGVYFEQPWNKREVGFCLTCSVKKASELGRSGARLAMQKISQQTVERQINAFNDLQFNLGRQPLKKEWESHCKSLGIPFRLHLNGLPTFEALKERAAVANHRVVLVEFAGYEDVYNGTVDEFHNYYIGHHQIIGKDWQKPRFSYVNTENCGEIPLTVGEPCDLGAINLASYVEKGTFDFENFRKDIHDCVRFLDDVLDVNKFALQDNKEASQKLRRLGLGVMGLADALIKLGLRYDSEAGRAMIDKIISVMREESIKASEDLAIERGSYPVFDQFSPQNLIPHEPRRNVAVLTVAPTGTTSMLMGVSSGIEPVFSPFIWRKIGSDYKAIIAPLFKEMLEQYPPTSSFALDDGWDWDKVTEALSDAHGSVQGLDWVPAKVRDVFVCAHDIKPLDHVRMQGTVQGAFDADGFAANSLSKTINLPNEATIEDIEAAYTEAYLTGCKGITVYRDCSRQFQVLSTSKNDKKEEKREEIVEFNTFNRPNRLVGMTDMVKLTDMVAGSQRTFLITTNFENNVPVEVIVTSGRAGDESNADSEALGRVVSIALQYGVPPEALKRTLRGINGGLYGSYNGRLVASKADLIAVALESTVPGGAILPAEQPLLYADEAINQKLTNQSQTVPLFPTKTTVNSAETCPSCKSPTLIREEGCQTCHNCGYSKCG